MKISRPYLILLVLLGTTLIGCTNTTPVSTNTTVENSNVNKTLAEPVVVNKSNTNQTVNTNQQVVTAPALAFFYQTVGKIVDGTGINTVQVGRTTDGVTIDSFDATALDWEQGPAVATAYGDPVFSYLPNGSWSVTSWTTPDDPRGGGAILYHESGCPVVDDTNVIAINPSTAAGCTTVGNLQIGKTSQVFGVDGDTYLFHTTSAMLSSAVHLAHLSDTNNQATALTEMCVLPTAVNSLTELGWGESTPVVTSDSLLLSDTAIAQRADGTWVLFIKGIPRDNGCEQNRGLCELCARSIYRTTSSDLINWSELEVVAEQASVPEATQTVDGTVWLYWQDFSDACAAQDQQLANIAPIASAYELDQSYELSSPVRITISDEAFEQDKTLHYATNGNPVMLPDGGDAGFTACFE